MKRNRLLRQILSSLMIALLGLSSCRVIGSSEKASTLSTSVPAAESSSWEGTTEETTQQKITLPPGTSQEETAVDSTEETTEEPTVDPMTLVTAFVYCKAETLNVRSGESTESEPIGAFKMEEEIPLIGEMESGWFMVVCEGQIGYVSGEYVTYDRDWREKEMAEYPYGYQDGESVTLQSSWVNSGFSVINSGAAVMYRATENRKNIVVGVNAGHGCSGGGDYYTYSHPDMTPKITGGTNDAGAVRSMAISSGMTFTDGTAEKSVNLAVARYLRDLLLAQGFDVLMLRDGEDVQLDNVARTVICNNAADCHVAIHFDGDGLSYDKGCFFFSVPDGLKYLDPVSYTWEKSEALGRCLMDGLAARGNAIYDYSGIDQDLTQTSYSSVPSVDVELGNQSSDHSEAKLLQLAEGLAAGIAAYFGY